jgi:hypothetical protein
LTRSGPRVVGFVVAVCGNLGRHFCRRSLCRSRSVVTRFERMFRWAWLAAAARAAGELVAVTRLWTMVRVTSRRVVVKEILSVLIPVVVVAAA